MKQYDIKKINEILDTMPEYELLACKIKDVIFPRNPGGKYVSIELILEEKEKSTKITPDEIDALVNGIKEYEGYVPPPEGEFRDDYIDKA